MSNYSHAGRRREDVVNDYSVFTEKFKPKQTTDDCETPPAVYEVVEKWAREHCRISSEEKTIRPFWPGANYKDLTQYKSPCVVIDNPPFSILAEIIKFYNERGIKFFLFCNALTSLYVTRYEGICFIMTQQEVVYENGAKLKTAFVTNCYKNPDACICFGKSLADKIKQAQKKLRKPLATGFFVKPKGVIGIRELLHMSYTAKDMTEISRKGAEFFCNIDHMRRLKKTFFGGVLFLSEKQDNILTEACPERDTPYKPLSCAYLPTVKCELSEKEQFIMEKLNERDS